MKVTVNRLAITIFLIGIGAFVIWAYLPWVVGNAHFYCSDWECANNGAKEVIRLICIIALCIGTILGLIFILVEYGHKELFTLKLPRIFNNGMSAEEQQHFQEWLNERDNIT